MSKFFIVVGQDGWQSASATDIGNLCKALAKTHRILYCEPPCCNNGLTEGDGRGRNSRKGRILRGGRQMLRQVTDNMIIFSPPVVMWSGRWFPSVSAGEAIRRINARRYADSVGWAAKMLSVGEKMLITDNGAIMAPSFIDVLTPEVSFYYVNRPPIDIPVLRACDVAVSTSQILAEAAANYHIHSFNIGEGVNPVTGKKLRQNWYKSAARLRSIADMLSGERKNGELTAENEIFFN